MQLMRSAVAVLTSMVLSACRDVPEVAPPIQVEISVEADPGVPLSGVPVRVDGESVGRSDSRGLLRTTVFGRPGQLVRFGQDCPEGHRAPAEGAALRLRKYDVGDATRSLEVKLECRPEARLAAFVVRAPNAPNIPVLVDGEIVARTNGAGVAHFSRLAPAGTEYLVELDARDYPALLPRTTSHLLTLPDFNELFVIDQTFEKRKKAGSSRATRRRIIKIE
jgi:hypothetical protein